MIVIENNQVYSTTGKFVHRIGTETYFKKGTVLKSDSVDSFEEVEAIPEMPEEEMPIPEIPYKEQVVNKIRERYSVDDELAILRQRDTKPDEFEAYNEYAEQCKKEVKDILINKDK